jgi:hypothetical protein
MGSPNTCEANAFGYELKAADVKWDCSEPISYTRHCRSNSVSLTLNFHVIYGSSPLRIHYNAITACLLRTARLEIYVSQFRTGRN